MPYSSAQYRDTSRYALRKRAFISYDETPRNVRRRAASSFRFQLLPREIRNMIYEIVVAASSKGLGLGYRLKTAQQGSYERSYRQVLAEEHLCKRNMCYICMTQGRLDRSTRNVCLLRTCKWIWREATPMLYGKRFKVYGLKVLADFLSRLRPELLACLAEVELLDGIKWYNLHRFQDVVHYLVQASSLQKLEIHLPEDYFAVGPRTSRSFDRIRNNQAVFSKNVDHFNTGLARAFAYSLYRKHLGVWMSNTYRMGGINRLSQTFVVSEWQITCLWSYALGDRYQFWNLWICRFWTRGVWHFLDETRCNTFRKALFVELDRLLSQRQAREQSVKPNAIGRRRSIRSWQAIDFDTELPENQVRIP